MSEASVGIPVQLLATIQDEDADDSHTAAVDWGDGALDQCAVSGTTATATHAFLEAGSYTTRVCAQDSHGGEGCTSLLVDVGQGSVIFVDDFESAQTDRWSTTRP